MNFENSDAEYVKQPKILLSGSSKCIIDGLKSVMQYTSDKIKIDLGKYAAVITGSGLYIESFSYEGATIQGDIIAVEMSSND